MLKLISIIAGSVLAIFAISFGLLYLFCNNCNLELSQDKVYICENTKLNFEDCPLKTNKISLLDFVSSNTNVATINIEEKCIEAINVGVSLITVQLKDQRLNFTLYVQLLENENLSFENESLTCFINNDEKYNNLILYNNEAIFPYAIITYEDENIVEYNAISGTINLINVGETTVYAYIPANDENVVISFNVNVTNYNFVSSIEFIDSQMKLLITDELLEYPLIIEYLYEDNEYMPDVNLSSSNDNVEFTANGIILLNEGETVIYASSQGIDGIITAEMTLIIYDNCEIKTELLNASDESVTFVKSGYKADGLYDDYVLVINACYVDNYDNFIIYINEESANLVSDLSLNGLLIKTIDISDGKIYVPINFIGAESLSIKIETTNEFYNFEDSIVSNTIDIEVVEYINEINEKFESYQGADLIYNLVATETNGINYYTIYYALGDDESLQTAILDSYPYYFAFKDNQPFSIAISSDNSILLQDGLIFTSIASGQTFITLTANDGSIYQKTIVIVVEEIEVQEYYFDSSESIELLVGETYNLSPTYLPIYASSFICATYTLSDMNVQPVCSIENGIITAICASTVPAKIIVALGDYEIEYSIVVRNETIAIQIYDTFESNYVASLSLTISQIKNLRIITEITITSISIESSDNEIVSVSITNQKLFSLTALKAGTVTITIELNNDPSLQITLEVVVF